MNRNIEESFNFSDSVTRNALNIAQKSLESGIAELTLENYRFIELEDQNDILAEELSISKFGVSFDTLDYLMKNKIFCMNEYNNPTIWFSPIHKSVTIIEIGEFTYNVYKV